MSESAFLGKIGISDSDFSSTYFFSDSEPDEATSSKLLLESDLD
jgi:hypothetical protein